MDHPSFDEIAAEMGLKTTQVKGYYRSGLDKLRTQHPQSLRMLKSLAAGLHHTPEIETNEELD